jgi:hypothetical protein
MHLNILPDFGSVACISIIQLFASISFSVIFVASYLPVSGQGAWPAYANDFDAGS